MKQPSNPKQYLMISAGGLLLLLLGLFLLTKGSGYTIFALSVGGSLTLQGLLSWAIWHGVYTKDEKNAMGRQESIHRKDERNIAIREKSAYRANQIMLVLLIFFAITVNFILTSSVALILLAWGLVALQLLLPAILSLVYNRRL